jgi:putative FmdB family regulatory protein
MHIYEYQCGVCGHKFEVLQNLGEDGSNLKCPKCVADNPQKVFSVFSGSNASSKSSSACSSGGFS